jgi:hypothetical protein
VRGGDNRPLPVKAYPEIKLQPPPNPADTLIHITVQEAAGQIGNTRSRTLILLYATWSQDWLAGMPALTNLARECRKAGVEVLAFNTDQEPRALWNLPGILRRNAASFQAVHLSRWQPGQFVPRHGAPRHTGRTQVDGTDRGGPGWSGGRDPPD